MKRLTAQEEGAAPRIIEEALHKGTEGYEGEAADRLAAFERFYGDLAAKQPVLAAELEALRAAGKKNSAKFRERLGEKVTGANILAILKAYGIGD